MRKFSPYFILASFIFCGCLSDGKKMIDPHVESFPRIQGNIFDKKGEQDSLMNNSGEFISSGSWISLQESSVQPLLGYDSIELGKPKLQSKFRENKVILESRTLKGKIVVMPETREWKERVVRESIVPSPIQVVDDQIERVRDEGVRDLAKYDIKYIDVEQGLKSSYLSDVFQDSKGRMWLATNGGGVVQHDGTYMHFFRRNNGMPVDVVEQILEDDRGRIWMMTWHKGIICYDGENFVHYYNKEGLKAEMYNDMAIDASGDVYCATSEGIYRISEGQLRLIDCEYTDGQGAFHLEVDTYGNIVGVDEHGVFKIEDGVYKRFHHEFFNDGAFSCIESKSDGSIVIGNAYSELYTIEQDLTLKVKAFDVGEAYVAFNSICEGEDGALWVGSDGLGVVEVRDDYYRTYGMAEGMSNDYIMDVLVDDVGNVWAGTDGAGVSRLTQGSFSNYTTYDGFEADIALTVECDSKGRLWFGTQLHGVSMVKGDSLYSYNNVEGMPQFDIGSIVEGPTGEIYFGTRGYGLYQLEDGVIRRYTEKNGLKSNGIWRMDFDSNGDLWIASNKGVSKFDGTRFTNYDVSSGLSDEVVHGVYCQGNDVWLCNEYSGVSLIKGDSVLHITEDEGLPLNDMWTIFEDSKERMWFGTWGGGLAMIENGQIKVFDEKNGLSNDMIWSIIEDEEHRIWVTSERGINCLVQKDSEWSVHRYDKRDGLKGTDFYVNSATIDKENRAWWGSGKGLIHLDLGRYDQNSDGLGTEFSELKVNGMHVETLEGVKYSSLSSFNHIPLDLVLNSDLNSIDLSYSSRNWEAPHDVFFSYQVNEDEWSKPNRRAALSLKKVSPGKYTIKVRAKTNDGVWGDPVMFEFEVLNPWYLTSYAIIAWVLVVVLFFYALLQWRTLTLRKRQAELSQQVREKTKEVVQERDEAKRQKDVAEEQRQMVAEKNKEILDSILYAKRIQDAILPSLNMIHTKLGESFLLYKPKDIVAGDFYWLEERGGYVYFAAADCTGHGVPGAMVSVMCSNALTKCVQELNISSPAEILDKAVEILESRFENADEQVRDGMDLALCRLDPRTNELVYAGANNPLWVIRKGEKLADFGDRMVSYQSEEGELIEIKPDKQPVGVFEARVPFRDVSLSLESEDQIYVFSDGYADQFGGNRGKKMKYKLFKQLIISLKDLPMEVQKEKIDNFFMEWKGDLEQLDDVVVIGVKIA